MMRLSGAALTLACLLPSAAWADCQDRIAAIENHPALAQQGEAPSGGARQDEEVVREGNGETTYADGGPAVPNESWFTDSEDDARGTVLTHLDAAKLARQSGDEAACLEAVDQAEAALQDG